MAQAAVTAPAFTVLDLPGGERNLIGLARVSTDAQDAQLQRDALTLAGCGRIFEEKASTRKATTDRPGLVAALDYMRAGDTLAVWKLDRLGRSVKDALTIADDLHARGIGDLLHGRPQSGGGDQRCGGVQDFGATGAVVVGAAAVVRQVGDASCGTPSPRRHARTSGSFGPDQRIGIGQV